MRLNDRKTDELRPISIETAVSPYAEGSALISFGNTKVLCTASVEEHTPKWLQGTGKGWVTAEYSMLPRSTHTRIKRDRATNSGRSQEISRLIARSLRAAVDLTKINEKNIVVDCDVITADGGTRTAAITGGFVALALALKKLQADGAVTENPVLHKVSAVSVGIAEGTPLLDLCYEEDVKVDTDMNFVFVDNGNFVEIQGTAEDKSFSREEMNAMIDLAEKGCKELFDQQAKLLS